MHESVSPGHVSTVSGARNQPKSSQKRTVPINNNAYSNNMNTHSKSPSATKSAQTAARAKVESVSFDQRVHHSGNVLTDSSHLR